MCFWRTSTYWSGANRAWEPTSRCVAFQGAAAMLEATLVNKHSHDKTGQGDVNKKWNEKAIKRGNLPCEVAVGSRRPVFGSDATCQRFGSRWDSHKIVDRCFGSSHSCADLCRLLTPIWDVNIVWQTKLTPPTRQLNEQVNRQLWKVDMTASALNVSWDCRITTLF